MDTKVYVTFNEQELFKVGFLSGLGASRLQQHILADARDTSHKNITDCFHFSSYDESLRFAAILEHGIAPMLVFAGYLLEGPFVSKVSFRFKDYAEKDTEMICDACDLANLNMSLNVHWDGKTLEKRFKSFPGCWVNSLDNLLETSNVYFNPSNRPKFNVRLYHTGSREIVFNPFITESTLSAVARKRFQDYGHFISSLECQPDSMFLQVDTKK
jgi:hypothetical protein